MLTGAGEMQVYDVPLGESVTYHFLSCPKKTRSPVCTVKFSRTIHGTGSASPTYYLTAL